MFLQFEYPHDEYGDIEVTVTHYLEDTQHLEDGSPMEIEYTVTSLGEDISHLFDRYEVESMLVASCERVGEVFDYE